MTTAVIPHKIKEAEADSFALVLPRHIPKERFIRTLESQVSRSKKLMELVGTPNGRAGVMKAAMKAAEYGLPLGTHAYIIPYAGEPTMVPDYKGILDVWARDGSHVCPPELVRENDHFDMARGVVDGKLADKLVHRRAPTNRGKVIGGYVLWATPSGKASFFYMTIEELQSVKEQALKKLDRYPEKKKNSPWTTNEEIMYLKTIVKRGSKWGNTNPEVISLVMHDDRQELGEISGTFVDEPTSRTSGNITAAAPDTEDDSEPAATPAKRKKKTPATPSTPPQEKSENPAPEGEGGDGDGDGDDGGL